MQEVKERTQSELKSIQETRDQLVNLQMKTIANKGTLDLNRSGHVIGSLMWKWEEIALIVCRIEHSRQSLYTLWIQSRSSGIDPLQAASNLYRITITLALDVSDFFIHSRILMDRIPYLMAALVPHPKNRPVRSYSDYLNFFKDKTKVKPVDDQCIKLFLESQKWFTQLKDVRDDFIVHFPKVLAGGLSYKDIMPTYSYFDESVLNSLQRICEKYDVVLIQSFADGTRTVYPMEALDSLESKKLTAGELEKVKEIRQKVGGKLPDYATMLSEMSFFMKRLLAHLMTDHLG